MSEGDWEGKVWAGRACSPPHPHLHIQVSSGIQQHLHHRLVPTDAGVHQGGHALRWLKPETETFTRWLWSVNKHMECLIGVGTQILWSPVTHRVTAFHIWTLQWRSEGK